VNDPSGDFPPILNHLWLGNLNGTNGLPNSASPADVAMALSFSTTQLPVNDTFIIDILISEDGALLGSFGITQLDSGPDATGTQITYSGNIGQKSIPEGSILGLIGMGLVSLIGFRRRQA
jgi:hypothetical protein